MNMTKILTIDHCRSDYIDVLVSLSGELVGMSTS